MSLLADLYVSRDDEEAIRYNSEPAQFTDREEYTSFTTLELSTLWAEMQGKKWDEDLFDEFLTVFAHEEEPHISRLPTAMVLELARMTPEQVLYLASKWAATDEMRCSPEDARPIIEGLIRLAKKAFETERSLYFWNSL
jgi:hypothetical protein